LHTIETIDSNQFLHSGKDHQISLFFVGDPNTHTTNAR